MNSATCVLVHVVSGLVRRFSRFTRRVDMLLLYDYLARILRDYLISGYRPIADIFVCVGYRHSALACCFFWLQRFDPALRPAAQQGAETEECIMNSCVRLALHPAAQ